MQAQQQVIQNDYNNRHKSNLEQGKKPTWLDRDTTYEARKSNLDRKDSLATTEQSRKLATTKDQDERCYNLATTGKNCKSKTSHKKRM